VLKKISYFVYFLSLSSQLLCVADVVESTINLKDLLKNRKDIKYIQVSDATSLYPQKAPFPDDVICSKSGQIVIPETFVVSIPHGRVYSHVGLIIVDGMYVEDFFWEVVKAGIMHPCVDLSSLASPRYIDSKVAVITQLGVRCYYHWMLEVLPRLGLLQESNLDYDYLYLPFTLPYMKESLELLGVDLSTVIQPRGENLYIEADELIVPSAASAFRYSSQFAIDFLRNKFIPLAQSSFDSSQFSKKVFISRHENSIRRIKNEDEIFELFREQGFVRYKLEDLSILEQVSLFHNANIIVGEHGAGLTNIVFAQPGTQVIEIFQACNRLTYWYLSQELGLNHAFVQTVDFDSKIMRNSCPVVSLEPIKNIIDQLF